MKVDIIVKTVKPLGLEETLRITYVVDYQVQHGILQFRKFPYGHYSFYKMNSGEFLTIEEVIDEA